MTPALPFSVSIPAGPSIVHVYTGKEVVAIVHQAPARLGRWSCSRPEVAISYIAMDSQGHMLPRGHNVYVYMLAVTQLVGLSFYLTVCVYP